MPEKEISSITEEGISIPLHLWEAINGHPVSGPDDELERLLAEETNDQLDSEEGDSVAGSGGLDLESNAGQELEALLEELGGRHNLSIKRERMEYLGKEEDHGIA